MDRADLDRLERDPGLKDRYQKAIDGRAEIACFDAWARELVEIARYVNEQIDARARSDEEHPSDTAPAPPAKQPKTRFSWLRQVRTGSGAEGVQPVDGKAAPAGGSRSNGTAASGRSPGSDRPPGPREATATNE